MNKNIHLLVTTATDYLNSERYNDTLNTIESVKTQGTRFESVNLLETVLTEKKDLYQDDFIKFTNSTLGNPHKYKGTNWINHVYEFVMLNYNMEDIIVFLAGRYTMVSNNMFNLIDEYIINQGKYFIAKSDADIYKGDGVHTFYITFTKEGLIDFYNFYNKLDEVHPCIEWDLKKFMLENEKCEIINKNVTIGVKTNTSQDKIKKIC
jgi:hypothetical protein